MAQLQMQEQQSPPWIRGGFKTPGHGLVIIHPNEARSLRLGHLRVTWWTVGNATDMCCLYYIYTYRYIADSIYISI